MSMQPASGSSTPPTDKRGKRNNHHCIDSDLVKQVRNHIESFPAQESHYSHSDNHGKLFLSVITHTVSKFRISH